MKRGMTTEYLKCRANLNFEVDLRVNGAIGTIVTKWAGSYFIRMMDRFHQYNIYFFKYASYAFNLARVVK